nr:nicalin-1 [Tanacetum cinerariifolium]
MALYEIARIFSILYSNPNIRGRYNILFRLTSGGPYNYNGTQNNSLRSREYGLWLHVSKSPENAYVKQIFKGLSNVAEEVGVTVRLKHKFMSYRSCVQGLSNVAEEVGVTVRLKHKKIN